MKTAYDAKPDLIRTIRFVNQGRLPTRWYRLATHLYDWHEERVWTGKLKTAKRPGVVASAVYVAGNTLNLKPRQSDCVKACAISEPTLRKISDRLWLEAFDWSKR